MKSCIQCGAEAADNANNCAECGREFTFKGTSTETVSSAPSPLRIRPNGSGLKIAGGALFFVALFALIGGWLYPVAEYSFSEVDPPRVAIKGNLTLFGSSAIQIGAMVWLVGAVIEAISFLPGRND